MHILKDTLCIAISGKSGCGNTSTGTMIANALGISLINYTFRNKSEQHNISLTQICEEAKNNSKWDYLVDNTQKKLAKQSSCVVGSRLAIWVIKNADLRVYLYADEKERAKRIQRREGGVFTHRLKETKKRDARDTKRYKKLYDININNYKNMVDLVVNTTAKSKEEVLHTILLELQTHSLISKH